MGHPFKWMERTAWNLDGARKFYSQLLEWEMEEYPGRLINHNTSDAPSQTGIGMMNLRELEIPDISMIYTGVDDIESSCRRLEELGGRIVKAPMDILEVGRIAVVRDPEGAYIGLLQAVRSKKGESDPAKDL